MNWFRRLRANWHTPENDFTHVALFYGLPCYFNMKTDRLVGRTLLYDWLLQKAALPVCAVWEVVVATFTGQDELMLRIDLIQEVK